MIHGGSGLHGCLGMSDDVLAIQSMCWKKPGRLHHIFHSGSFKLRVVRRITTQPFALGRFSWAWSKCWKDKSSLKSRHPCVHVSRALAVEKKRKHGPPIHNSSHKNEQRPCLKNMNRMDQNGFNWANEYQLHVQHAAASVFMMLNPSILLKTVGHS